MKNIDFKEVNVAVHLTNPSLHYKALRTGDYMVFCFKMSWKERLKALFTGKVWVSKIAPIDQHLQPFVLTTDKSKVIQDGNTKKGMAKLT